MNDKNEKFNTNGSRYGHTVMKTAKTRVSSIGVVSTSLRDHTTINDY